MSTYQVTRVRPGYYNDGDGSVNIICNEDNSKNARIIQSNCVLDEQQIVKIYEHLQKNPNITSTHVSKQHTGKYEGPDNEFSVSFYGKDGKSVEQVKLSDLPEAENTEMMEAMTGKPAAKKDKGTNTMEDKSNNTDENISQEKRSFTELVNKYYREKNGFEEGIYYDTYVWREPKPDEAAKTKELLLSLIKSGHKMDIEGSSREREFAEELACEHLYKGFSAQDKKLIEDLKNDNIDEIRKSLNGEKIPDNVERYMEAVPPKHKKGRFYQYYKDVMYKDDKPRDIEPYNFANAEKKYVYNATYNSSLDNLIKMAEFKPEGIIDAVAQKFYMEFDHPNSESYLAELNTSYQLADKLNKMNPECKNAVSALMAQKIGDKLHHANPDEPGHTIRLLSFTMKLYDVSESEGKNALRLTMLKFRTTGSNEEKRVKADMFKNALKRGDLKDNIQKDETIKAVSSVSYTPLSSLNRQLMKHGKEIEGR